MSLPADQAHREAARTTFSAPVVVEAGAGTGKTAVLVTRTVTWLVDVGWARHDSPDQDAEDIAARVAEGVLALTFTEKAAGEMASRVGKALERLAQGETVLGMPAAPFHALSPDEVRVRAKACLVHLDRISITTIHAWCRRLLASFPLEARLHPGFEVDADGIRRRAVVDEVLARWVASAFSGSADEDALAVARSGRGPDAIWEALAILAESNTHPEMVDTEAFHERRFPAAHGRLMERLEALVETASDLLDPACKAGLGHDAAVWLSELRSVVNDSDRFTHLCTALQSTSADAPLKRVGEWAGGRFTKGELSALPDQVETVSLAAARFTAEVRVWRSMDPDLQPRVARVLRHLTQEVRARLASRGIVSFPELLERSESLLRREDVCAAVRSRIELLLVDEFQDTDPLQYQIVGRLALTGDPRPSLFLVGDPKQSIYGWRQADLSAYERFLQRLDTDPLQLSVNFRSVPPILDEVQRVMTDTMVRAPDLQPDFQPLEACEKRTQDTPFTAGGRRSVESWVSWGPNGPRTTADEARDLEASAIAQDIGALHREHQVPWGHFAILFRARSPLERYLRKLRDAGIPFHVEGGQEFYRRREVMDAVNLIRVVLDGNDHLALLGFIRSPMVGTPDAAVIPLWERGFPGLMSELHRTGHMPSTLADVITDAAGAIPPDAEGAGQVTGWECALREAIRSITLLRHSFATEPANVFVDRLRELSFAEPIEGARYLGEHRAANLDQLFRRVMELLTRRETGPDLILRALTERVRASLPEQDAAVGEDEVDAVRIMTIHMAKGLDFNHVYLPDLHRSAGDRETAETRIVDTAGGFESRLMGLPTPGWGPVREREAEVRDAESVRLLYVALTRASDRLVMAGRWPDPSAISRATTTSLLRLIGTRPGDWTSILAPWASGMIESTVETDEHQVLWRLLQPIDEDAHTNESGEAAAEDVGATVDRSRRWLSERRQSSEHAAREIVGAASQGSHEALVDVVRLREEGDEREPERTPLLHSGDEHGIEREVGTAVHRILEELDLHGDPAEEWAAAALRAPQQVADLLSSSAAERATEEVRDFVQHLSRSSLGAALFALKEHVLGREVPIILRPEAAPGATATGAVVGAIDLLYKDPKTDEVVVADFKTDKVSAGATLTDHARRYAGQGATYANAVKVALDLDRPPRFELWFLRHDERV